MLFTINNSLNGVGKIFKVIFEHYQRYSLHKKFFKYLICLVSQTKVQYEPGNERMLLFGSKCVC